MIGFGKKSLILIVGAVAIIEIAWLVLANLALNLPLTQELVNNHRPENYTVHWERAWSWYPLRFHATGISANGQTSSQQWQVETLGASASLSVFPLMARTLRISGVDVDDIELRVRPRPGPDRNFEAVRTFFPPIPGRDPDLPAALKSSKPGTGWRIVADDIRVRGSHKVWIYQARADFSGELGADIQYLAPGGPFALMDGRADVEVASLVINDREVVSPGGTLAGRFEMAPFVPSEHRGSKALDFLTTNAEVDLRVDSLDFLDIYLAQFDGMEVDGNGTLRGRVHYEKGNFVEGTDMSVSAPELALEAAAYRVQGTGDIAVRAGMEEPDTLELQFGFGTLKGFHDSIETALFEGEKLDITIRGSNRILPDELQRSERNRFVVTIPKVAFSDLRAYQYLLPDKWPVLLNGGAGVWSGRAEISSSSLAAELRLVSDNADVAFRDYRFVTNLDLGITASGRTADTANIDFSGSYLKLADARVAGVTHKTSKPWHASLAVSEGMLGVPVTAGETAGTDFRHLMQTMMEQEFSDVLATMDADLAVQLNVSDLGWLNTLFRNDFDLAIAGAGEAMADIDVHSGWLAKGSTVRIHPQGLKVQVLDYVAQGEGLVDLEVEHGGEAPTMVLGVNLRNGKLQRRGEADSVVEDVTLEVTARARDVTFGNGGTVTSVDLRIPQARVRDMSVYNRYFPEQTPLRISEGEAELTADVHFERDSAAGYLKLHTNGLRTRLDEQELSGELALDIHLTGGVPADMDFDISGSSLRLDSVMVVGERKSFDDAGWTARFGLDKAHVMWKRPVHIEAEGSIAMNDARPIVALMANRRGKYGWIEKLLTVEEIKGAGRLDATADRILVPYALVGSDKIDLGVKGLIDADTREAIFFARFRKLNGILKTKDGVHNFDIIGARKKFDAYAPGQTEVFMDFSAEDRQEKYEEIWE